MSDGLQDLNLRSVVGGGIGYHLIKKRPIQSADGSRATVGWRRPEFPGGLGSKQIPNVL
jgi:hypothetical protein